MSAALTTRIPIKDARGNVIEEKEVATYAGLLSRAHEEGLKLVETKLVQVPSEENHWVAIVAARVVTDHGTFEGIGDACPDNVNRRIAPHIIRMAETRAKARALRDAVNIGVVALEELGGEVEDEPEVFPRGNTQGGDVRHFPRRDDRAPRRVPNLPVRGEARPGGRSNDGMTEAQRKLLFRMLAEGGIEGENARRVLCEEAGVEDLRHITKKLASSIIDRWKRDAESA